MILMLGDSLCTGFGNCVYDISSVVYVFRINRLEFFFFFFLVYSFVGFKLFILILSLFIIIIIIIIIIFIILNKPISLKSIKERNSITHELC
jgi:hypothetical protein